MIRQDLKLTFQKKLWMKLNKLRKLKMKEELLRRTKCLKIAIFNWQSSKQLKKTRPERKH
jgi:hypothetical protein